MYLVGPDHAPPDVADCLEDWIRLPATREDIAARARSLAARAAIHRGTATGRPDLDSLGVLRMGDQWVELPPIEARILRPLVERFGRPVETSRLLQAGWEDASPTLTALRVHMVRLRRRLSPLGLRIGNVAGRGYLLERQPGDGR